MILFKEAAQLTKYIEKLRRAGTTIGFVPTMGALHEGHLSLIAHSESKCNVTVSSIFVNPTQFNNAEDFEKYPVTISNDVLVLERTACDVLFLPTVKEIYPNGTRASYYYDLGNIEQVLEGKYRPGHFQGVCQVVHRLLDIVMPDTLFLGQKDYQQCLVIKRLVQLLDLPIQVITGETFREASGLAMSSRNLRLTEAQKQSATAISKMLRYIKDNYTTTNPEQLTQYATKYLLNNGFEKVDYISIADANTLQPIDETGKKGKAVALIAAYIGNVRLIDNMVLEAA